MPLRTLRTTCFVCLAVVSALAQSYQSSFSAVQFDRAKGPATFTSGVEVDAATGAASMNIPIGPGIGERGIKYRPILSMRISPQVAISSANEDYPLFEMPSGDWYTIQQAVDTGYQRGYGSSSFSPGVLDLGHMVSTVDNKQLTYSLPGGGGGRVLGQVPAAVTPAVVQAMLPAFGFTSSDLVGYLPGPAVPLANRFAWDAVPAVQMSSTGQLVLGLRVAGTPDAVLGTTDEVTDDIQYNPQSAYSWQFPRRMLVIAGDVAYEYQYVDHTYMTRTIPYLAISQKNQLYSAHYMLTKIRNRFGESISFVYDADGIGYTATWSTNPKVSIRVQVVGTATLPAGQSSLMVSNATITSATQIRVTYLGISQPVSTYLIEESPVESNIDLLTGPASPAAATSAHGQRAYDMTHFDTPNLGVQPFSILEEGTGQQISFNWGSGYSTGAGACWNGGTTYPTVLSSVTFGSQSQTTPNRTVTLLWQVYRYRQNYNSETWLGIVPSSAPGRPTYFFGVAKVSDVDASQRRITTHNRVLPTSNWVDSPTTNPPLDQWVDTTFYDAITYPDGSTVLHRFVEPPSTNALTGPAGMQNLAFIKTLERETRYYAAGVDYMADLSVTSPAASSAYKWVEKDRFDVLCVGDPTTNNLTAQAVPYPTRTRTWDKDSQVLTVEETTDWDSTNFGWKTNHLATCINSSPDLTPDFSSLAQQGLDNPVYPATLGVERETDTTFNTDLSNWFIARVATHVTKTLHDNTGFLATGVGLPDIQPSVNKNYEPESSGLDRVNSVDVVGSDGMTVTTLLTYQGTSHTLSAAELASANLNSSGLLLSGLVGVSAYGCDPNGYLNSINQKPNAGTTLQVGQSQDEIGRPMSQTDMNGKVTTLGWDPAGRLDSIQPPDGDLASSISYDTDLRGITVTRGAQVTGYRYNGFGDMILEKREGPGGVWSHKIHGYDAMGRKTGETIWQPGDGSAQEGDWAKPNLIVPVTTTTPSQTTCKSWGTDANGNPVCLSWYTSPATTTTVPAIYTGTSIGYDTRGRVTQTIDPNNIQVGTQYLGLTRQVTLGQGSSNPEVTLYTADAAGRLVQVTDALGQITHYFYDGGGRIRQVQQVGSSGLVQTRTWAYNGLGWLTSLTQPESGTTAYTSFTVAGSPTVTNYDGRILTMGPDWMGRPLSVVSSSPGDTSVAQTFVYDTALGGKGKLASSTDGSVTRTFIYGAADGRLDNLTTSLVIQGVPHAFTQSFTYDAYGNRTSGSTSNKTWTQAYLPETGMPSLLSYGSTGAVASTPWSNWDPVSWMLDQVSYGNGVKTNFSYDADQQRLTQILHSPTSGGPLAQWVYTYDPLGNLVQASDLVANTSDQYTYDSLNRLQSALVASPTYGDQRQQFTYDAFGNRTSSLIQGVTGWSGARGAIDSTPYLGPSALLNDPNRQVVNATFNASDTERNNQLPANTSAGASTGAIYDAQGNLTQVYVKPGDSTTQLTMVYDALGRVVQLANAKTNLVETYQYTAEGLRSIVAIYQGSVAPQNLVKIQYRIYNDARQLVSEYELVLE